jgi:hypothetical protein
VPIEIKAGETIAKDYFINLEFWKSLSEKRDRGFVIYGGDTAQKRELAYVIPWNALATFFAALKNKQPIK